TNQSKNKIERFNVGGRIFATTRETLLNSTIYSSTQRPSSVAVSTDTDQIIYQTYNNANRNSQNRQNYFTKLISDEDHLKNFVLKDDSGAYFVDRSSEYFEIILDFLKTGELNVRKHLIDCKAHSDGSCHNNINSSNTIELFNHDTQTLMQRLIREADFYMIDISDQLYNIVGDGLYVSDDLKSGKNSRRSLLFFDKEPIYKPASVFMNGLFMNSVVTDKEILVRNGTLEIFNDNHSLAIVAYPTTVCGDEQIEELQQQQPHTINQHRRSGASDSALIMRDQTRFNTMFTLREVRAPEQLMINTNGKHYYNLSDYNHSIQFTRIDSLHVKIKEVFLRTPGVTACLSGGSQLINNQTHSGTPPHISQLSSNLRSSSPTNIDVENTSSAFDEKDDSYFANFEYQSPPQEEHVQLVARPQSSFMNFISPNSDESVVVVETVLRILKTNFLVKNKKEFMYVESRNRVYWLIKKHLLVFELSNKNL
ncbi:hypothetical protein AKO1_009232, partial [Acrasis kona]